MADLDGGVGAGSSNMAKKQKIVEEADEKAHDTTIKVAVARDADLFEQIGKDIYLDLVDHDKVWSLCLEKQMPFNRVKEEVAREFGVPVECQRFWTWAKRQNHTYRPYRPLTRLEETQSIGQLRTVYNKYGNAEAELNLFLESVIGPDLQPIPPPSISEEDILVFFKLYDPVKLQLRYVGSLYVRSSQKPTEIVSKLNEKVGISPDEEIELYEEIKFERHHELDQIKDGDIICFQKVFEAGDHKYPNIPSFLEHVYYSQVVHFRSKGKPEEDAFTLELSKLHTYDDVADRVAKRLDMADPLKIRFSPHNVNLNRPDCDFPIEYPFEGILVDMLGTSNEGYDILYYEVLDVPLLDLQCQKTLKVAYYHATTAKEEPVIHSISLHEQSTVEDVLNEIKKKVNVSPPDAELRLLLLYRHRIYKVFRLWERIVFIDDTWVLRAEKIPEEEKDLKPGYRRIHVYHFIKEAQQKWGLQQVKNFGEPFFMIIHEDETLVAIKPRIQCKLAVPDDEFSNVLEVCIFSLDVIRTTYDDWEAPFLGLEHPE
ncbi:hypothetical protein Lser_V15G07976 [Lactuca serriola]